MKIQQTDDGYSVRVRQSWINDAMMCNERGRQAIVRPEWSKPNDATILGTAVHAGIAAHLLGSPDGVKVAHNTLNELLAEPFMRTKYSDEQLHDHIIRTECCVYLTITSIVCASRNDRRSIFTNIKR